MWEIILLIAISTMSYMLNPNILILKDGTENTQGKQQIISNINAC